MDNNNGGPLSDEINSARQKVLDSYHGNEMSAPTFDNADPTATFKDAPINQDAVSAEWQQYHSAWQAYYQNYYNDYYSKAAQSYLETEKLKSERSARHLVEKRRFGRKLIPLFVVLAAVIILLFLQYNRLIFAPIMAYVAPGSDSVSSSIEAVDPTVSGSVSADPRLIIPKLNIDVPVAFGIHYSEVMSAMNHGVAQFSIPGASALPGQIGNLVISGHSAGDIYSSNPYKFIFSGLERLDDGDLIYINYESTRYTYQMTSSRVVSPSDVSALILNTDVPMLTLITCTPLGTSDYRLLIFAEQISPDFSNAATQNEIDGSDSNYSMPSSSPTFFESLWNSITGN